MPNGREEVVEQEYTCYGDDAAYAWSLFTLIIYGINIEPSLVPRCKYIARLRD